jgi:hypothetical protein
MWERVFNIVNVIFELKSFKRKTHKVFRNIVSFKTFKKYAFESKKMKNK